MRIVATIAVLCLTACGDVGTDLPETTSTAELPAEPTTTTVPATDSATTARDPEPMEAELTDEMLDAIVRDAAERSEVEPGSVEVVSITEEVFNDSSLGCPRPGEFYSQVITPGYIVIVLAGGAELDYRVGTQPDYFKLCTT